jgi:hypothetical protein
MSRDPVAETAPRSGAWPSRLAHSRPITLKTRICSAFMNTLIQAFDALEYERYTAAVVPALHTRVCGASHETIPKRE